MKILFVWTGVTSYMADCWRRLASLEAVDLRIQVENVDSGSLNDASELFKGLATVDFNTQSDPGWKPDVVFAASWRSRITRKTLAHRLLRDVPKIFCLDMPWRFSPRCILARFVLRGYLSAFESVWVPGRSARRYARWLGFSDGRIHEGLYAVDDEKFRCETPACGRKGFLFVGRYSPEKRIDIVEKAYSKYRTMGGSWGFSAYGQGGKYVDASGMPGLFASHACLLLASSFDPWPLVALEARFSGCEVIASDRCGNCDELSLRKVPYGDVDAMAEEMLSVEKELSSPLCSISPLPSPVYSCRVWAERAYSIACHALERNFYCPGKDEIANGMARVARLLAADEKFSGLYIIHGAWNPVAWFKALKAYFTSRPFVRMAHGSYSPVSLTQRGRIKKLLARPIECFLLRKARTVLATCPAEKEWIEAYEAQAKVEIIDLKRFFPVSPRESRPFDGTLKVLYLGRNHPLKGIDALEEAVRSLSGEFAVELKTAFDATGDEKEALFAWCDALVLPSLSENFGITVAEALSHGKIALTTDGAPAWDEKDGVEIISSYVEASPSRRVELISGKLRNIRDKLLK